MILHAISIGIMDQSGVNTQIKGIYDLREDELLDHSMSRTYHDRLIPQYLQMHTNAY